MEQRCTLFVREALDNAADLLISFIRKTASFDFEAQETSMSCVNLRMAYLLKDWYSPGADCAAIFSSTGADPFSTQLGART